MIYIADGPSDIPVFSIIKQYGGKAFAVYKPQSEDEFRQVSDLQNQGRVHSFGPAEYTQGTQTYMWILTEVEKIASRIVKDRERVAEESTGAPPQHMRMSRIPLKRAALQNL